MSDHGKVVANEDDSIKVLGLSVRVYNALRRSRIDTLRELRDSLEQNEIWQIRNLGEKGVAEIEKKLASITVITSSPSPLGQTDVRFSARSENPVFIDLGPPQVPIHEVIKWQQALLAKQISAELLHPDVMIYGQTLGKLVEDKHIYDKDLYIALLNVLTSSVSVSDELEILLFSLSVRELSIIRRRHGFNRQTLESIAKEWDITRERVRQIENQGLSRLESVMASIPLVRIRSAIYFANDMNITFDDWSQRLLKTGLLGYWTEEKFASFAPVELMVAVCKLTGALESGIRFPESLNYILQLHSEGKPYTPAKALYLSESVRREESRLLQRHLQYSGAVSMDWLVEHESMSFNLSELQEILLAQEFFEVSDGWYMSMSKEYMPHSLHKSQVFHKTLFKMSAFCGPLTARDIMFGLEHALSKTDFPVPPVDVLSAILKNYGYSNENDRWFWDGSIIEGLNSGEKVILRTIIDNNQVAHHSVLAKAFIDSPMSFASLHSTLRRSPLFDNFEKGLYKLRGESSNYDGIERARSKVARIPVNLEVNRDTYGNIVIGANLGTLAIGNGTIMSDKLPNLEGEWNYSWDNEEISITVTKNEIRGLSKAIKHLGCEYGDRIKLTFNTWRRTVTVYLQEDDE